jgi:hypothetical protein
MFAWCLFLARSPATKSTCTWDKWLQHCIEYYYEMQYVSECSHAQVRARGFNHLSVEMFFPSTSTSNIRCSENSQGRIHASCVKFEVSCLQPYVCAAFASELDMSAVAGSQGIYKIFHRVHMFPSTKFLVILCCLKVLHSHLHVRARPSKRAQG